MAVLIQNKLIHVVFSMVVVDSSRLAFVQTEKRGLLQRCCLIGGNENRPIGMRPLRQHRRYTTRHRILPQLKQATARPHFILQRYLMIKFASLEIDSTSLQILFLHTVAVQPTVC